jgi:hypothetical protein
MASLSNPRVRVLHHGFNAQIHLGCRRAGLSRKVGDGGVHVMSAVPAPVIARPVAAKIEPHIACDSVELKPRGDLPCAVAMIGRKGFSRMCDWRSGYRRTIRCGRSGGWRTALASLTRRFEGLYSTMGRPSIPPETLLRATLLQAFFSVRSKRMLHTYPALGPTGQQLRRRHLVAPAPPDDAESSAKPTSPNEAYGHGQLVKALGTTRHQY